MKRSCLSCSAALALAALVCSCYSYKTVRVAVRVSAVEEEIPGRIARKTSDQGLRRRDAARSHTVYIRRYCATGVSAGPLEAINSRGVQSITAGRLGEAEILFNELVRENARNAAALNNLGIVYEITGRSAEAFEMYSRACLIEPDNDHFRHNFLFLTRRRDAEERK